VCDAEANPKLATAGRPSLDDCESATGLDTDRRRKQLNGFDLAGSNFGAYSHSDLTPLHERASGQINN
jgi:hypothetical protein